MSDDFKFQASVKIPHGPDNYRDSMLNIRAQTGEEFGQAVSYIAEHAADLATALQTIHASANVSASFSGPGTGNVQQDGGAGNYANSPGAPAQQGQQWSQQGSQQQGGFQGGGQPQPPGPALFCNHGQMQWRTAKPDSGKDWKGWFCSAPRNDPNKCKNQYV